METQLDEIMAQECDDSDSDIDDELEAMLYSQVHYGDTMDQEAGGAWSVDSSALTPEAVFNIDNTSDVAVVSCKMEPGNDNTGTDSDKGPVPLPEVVCFAASETASIKKDKIPPQFDLEAEFGMETKKDKYFCSAEVLKETVINKSELDAEGGFCLKRSSDRPEVKDCSAKSKSGSKLIKVAQVLESESEQEECALAPGSLKERAASSPVPKPPSTVISALPSTDFISLDAFNSRHNYKRTLSRMLASHSKSQSPKEIVTVDFDIHSRTTSSTSSNSDSKIMQEVSYVSESSTSTSDSESLQSSSDSDVAILGNTRSCTEESAAKDVTLNLAWNVNHADSKTIKKIEKESALEKHSEKWMVCKADVTRSLFNQRRYYTKNNVRCNNCNQLGHLSKLCPEPKKKQNCGLCGMEGHVKARCPNSLCFNCSLPGHIGARCPCPRRDRFAKCAHCQMKGHSEQDCPDHWRQYHSTVMGSKDLVTKNKLVNPRVYCCNCAKRGHFAYECREKRMDNFVFPSYPFVVRYNMSEHSHKAKGSWGKTGRSWQAASKDAQSRKQVEETRHAKRSKEKKKKKDYHAESKGYKQRKGSLTVTSSAGFRTVAKIMKPSHALSMEREGESYTSSHPASRQHSQSSSEFGKNKLWDSLKKSQRHKTSSSQSIPQLSEFARVFVDQELNPMYQSKKGGKKRSKAYDDQHFDWDGVGTDQEPPSKRRKKVKKADEGNADLVQVPKRRKRKEGKWKKGSAGEPSTPKRQKKEKAKLEKTCVKGGHSWEASRKAQSKKQYEETSHNKRPKGKQKKGTHPGPRNPKTQDSLIVTSSAGFRTVAKTIRLNHSYRNAQF